MSWLRLGITASLLAACTSNDATERAAVVHASLGEGVVARVGDEQIADSTVERIAVAQSIVPTAARDRAVTDAVFAVEARARSLDAAMRFPLRTALARAALDELVAAARAEGPPTDSELAAWTERLYYTLDRPESFRTVHAVVRVPPEADASKWDAAESVASAVSGRVVPAVELARGTSASELDAEVDLAEQRFIELARGTPAEGFELVVQALPPVAADGLTVQPEGRQPFDGAFVRVVTSLERRGSVSKPFRSSFGVHVALLLQRLPAVRVPVEERRRMLTPDIWDERIRVRRAELVSRLRNETSVQVERSADKLLEQAIPR